MSDAFIAALAKLKADIPPIRKTTRGQHGKYADYRHIQSKVDPILTRHGFMWNSKPTLEPFGDQLRFVLIYALTHLATGQAESGAFPLQETDPQKQGSQISSAQRYALKCVLDLKIEEEDDDGMAASEAPKRERTRTKIPGPDHERLRHSEPPDQALIERVKGPAPDARWDEPERERASIGDKQRSRIMRHLGNLSSHDRALRLQNIIGRDDIDSTNDLSWAEAAEVIKILEA